MRLHQLIAAVLAACAVVPATAAAQDRPPFQIIALGDSYASGEGAPQKPGQHNNSGVVIGEPNEWDVTVPRGSAAYADADDCHRSPLAGAAVAARRLAERFPGVDVRFRSFACSGAKIQEGLLREYSFRTPDSGGPIKGPLVTKPPQVVQLGAFQRSVRRVDALVMNVGGNDANFEGIVKRCFRIPPFVGHCDRQGTLDHFNEGFSTLGGRFDRLARALTRRTLAGSGDPEVEEPPRSVFLTGVPNIATGAGNAPCDNDRTDDNLVDNLTGDESRFVAAHIFPPLIQRFAASAQEHGWTFVPVAQRFQGHGICAPPGTNFINTNLEAVHVQGEDSASSGVPQLAISTGFAHPNPKGYEAYADALEPLLATQLRRTFTPEAITRVTPLERLAGDPPRVRVGFEDSASAPYRTGHRVLATTPAGEVIFSGIASTDTVDLQLPASSPERVIVQAAPCGLVIAPAPCGDFGPAREITLVAPPPVTDLQVQPGRPPSAAAGDGSAALTATWLHSDDADARRYVVTATTADRPPVRVEVRRLARAAMLAGLEDGATYRVSVQACGDFECSPAAGAPGTASTAVLRADPFGFPPPTLGKAALSPRRRTGRPGGTVRLRFAWEHPLGWNDLARVQLALRRGERVVGTVTLAGRPGRRTLRVAGALRLVDGEVPAPGLLARRVELPVTVRLARRLRSGGYALNIRARDAFGARQVVRGAGRLRLRSG